MWKSTVEVCHAGQRLVAFDVMTLRERLTFTLGGATYHARKAKEDGVLVLVEAASGLPLAQRVALGAFTSDFDVEASMPDGSVHVIRADRVSGLRQRVELRVGGVAVGAVWSEGLMRRTTHADLPEAWPLPVSVFVLWLVLRRFAAEDAAAAS